MKYTLTLLRRKIIEKKRKLSQLSIIEGVSNISKKGSAAIVVLSLLVCVLGATVVYLLLPTTFSGVRFCWNKTYSSVYVVTGNETWDYFTTTINTEQQATMTVNFTTKVIGPLAEWCDLTLRLNGVAFWNDSIDNDDWASYITEITLVQGDYNLTLSMEEHSDSGLQYTSLQVCVVYS